VPDVRTAVACCVADLHLSERVPAARGESPAEWLETQANYLRQIDDIARSLGVPVLIAGDVFDRWNAPAELINFAIDHMPTGVLSVPGNHDLPNHDLDQIERSAYWTLVRAGALSYLDETVAFGR
jgi:DNA repair exonuclease SbcCD nuclease subunit